MEHQRSHRVGESIQKEISALIIKGLKDPRIGFVTITAVDVTSDLRYARIYFTVIGDEESKKNSERALKNAVPFLRRELGKRLRLRYVPELTFLYDTSIDYGAKIETLLKEISPKEADDSGHTEDN